MYVCMYVCMYIYVCMYVKYITLQQLASSLSLVRLLFFPLHSLFQGQTRNQSVFKLAYPKISLSFILYYEIRKLSVHLLVSLNLYT